MTYLTKMQHYEVELKQILQKIQNNVSIDMRAFEGEFKSFMDQLNIKSFTPEEKNLFKILLDNFIKIEDQLSEKMNEVVIAQMVLTQGGAR